MGTLFSYIRYSILVLAVLTGATLFMSSCGGGGGGGGAVLPDSEIQGYVQKGPYATGASIVIQELNNSLTSTGDTHYTETLNNLGAFEIDARIRTNYIEIIAEGYYFNEITGDLSLSPLTLNALADLSENDVVNVNILTTLEKQRIRYLVKNEGLSFRDAREQAETEILNLFHIDFDNRYAFSEMDISQTGDYNAILLALSVILQGGHSVAELSELISNIGLDISTDGTLDNPDYVDIINANSLRVQFTPIINNLIDRYDALSSPIDVPRFEAFIDSDGDGIINHDDPETYIWDMGAKDIFGHGTKIDRFGHGFLVYDNKIWEFGGSTFHTHKDVWYSENGVNWYLATDDAPWKRRYGFGYTVYDNKIWLMGGYVEDGSIEERKNDVWWSSNGADWVQATDAAVWSPREGLSGFAFDNKLWILGGNSATEKTEVWYSEDGADWHLATDSAPGYVYYGSVIVFKNKIWIIGNVNSDVPGAADDIYCSENGVDWIQVEDAAPWGSRRGHSLVVFKDLLWLIGGRDGRGDYPSDPPYLGHVWYSSDGGHWNEHIGYFPWDEEVSRETATDLYNHRSVNFNNRIWVFGSSAWDTTEDIWFFCNYFDYAN